MSSRATPAPAVRARTGPGGVEFGRRADSRQNAFDRMLKIVLIDKNGHEKLQLLSPRESSVKIPFF
jgi:hypothetical protein